MSRLEGKVAVVTGANSGIGLATARLFAREGAQVFVTGRRQTELDEAVRQIGANAIGVTGDVSRLADLDRLYDIVRREAGMIDILFANAGGGDLRDPAKSPRRSTSAHSPRTSKEPCSGSKSAAADAGWWFDHSDGVHRWRDGHAGVQRVQRK